MKKLFTVHAFFFGQNSTCFQEFITHTRRNFSVWPSKTRIKELHKQITSGIEKYIAQIMKMTAIIKLSIYTIIQRGFSSLLSIYYYFFQNYRSLLILKFKKK